MELLNCCVNHLTLQAWKRHFAPVTQPFFARNQLPGTPATGIKWQEGHEAPDGLLVWWPTLFAKLSEASRQRLIAKLVNDDRPYCNRGELASARWEQIDRELPGVRARAGTFHQDSGPNRLGAVIEAFTGKQIPHRTERKTFGEWLQQQPKSMGEPTDLGTILIWHDETGAIQHAAVSLGDGYIFHKEEQTWWSPWQVVPYNETIDRWKDVDEVTAH